MNGIFLPTFCFRKTKKKLILTINQRIFVCLSFILFIIYPKFLHYHKQNNKTKLNKMNIRYEQVERFYDKL